MLINNLAECSICIYLDPVREAVQSGYTVETLQLCAAALRYVPSRLGSNLVTRGSNPRDICIALTPTEFFRLPPTISIAAKRSSMESSGFGRVHLDRPRMKTSFSALEFVTKKLNSVLSNLGLSSYHHLHPSLPRPDNGPDKVNPFETNPDSVSLLCLPSHQRIISTISKSDHTIILPNLHLPPTYNVPPQPSPNPPPSNIPARRHHLHRSLALFSILE